MLLLGGCAQVIAPTGGPKDITPPKAMDYTPENKSTNVQTNKIEITFDEYIQLKELSKQFIVSPPLKTLPVPIVKGRVLEIPLLKDTLQQNTTYTFNFGNAVCDLNESNPLKNFQYVFSTGPYIDSMSVHGMALDAFTHEPIKEGLVLLYSDMSDSTPYKKRPSYCGQTDDNGFYRIDNIKSGDYRIIAISKGSGDYFYHPYSQSIGFKSGLLSLSKSDTVNFFLCLEDQPKLQFIKAKAVDKGKILMIFNRPADSIVIRPVNIDISQPFKTIIQYSATHDSLNYWINYPDLDSLRFIVCHGYYPLDTAVVYNMPGHSNKKNKKVEKPLPITVNVNISEKSAYDYHRPFSMNFSTPVTNIDLSKISLLTRKDSIKLKQVSKASLYDLSLAPQKDLISDSSYRFVVMPGAFTDLFGATNDTINLKFKVEEQSYFGTLTLNLKFKNKTHYLVQLLGDQGAVSRQDTVNGTSSIFYDGLIPALYGIRIIQDDNNNGKWDGGNFLKNIQPEKVFYYPDKINIRSNWDLTPDDWKVN